MSKYTLGNISFKSKADIRLHYQAMLHSYNHNDDVNWNDSVELIHLLKHHPDLEEKRGVGIDKFIVKRWDYDVPDMWRTKCFWIVRKDGSVIDFSYAKTIDKIPVPKKQKAV